MTLLEIVRRLPELDEQQELTIYAVEPWQPDSEAMVIENLPVSAKVTFKTPSGANACYFLEVEYAKELLEGWRAGGYRSTLSEQHVMSLEEDCRRLIHYAVFDA